MSQPAVKDARTETPPLEAPACRCRKPEEDHTEEHENPTR